MKKLYILFAIMLSFSLFFCMIGNAFALDANRTYAIGCKFLGNTDHNGDDFTQNVNNAYTHYSSMPYYSHFKCTSPTVSALKNIQDSGLRMIGHKVVFLNSHGNYKCMVFQTGDTSEKKSGVYYGTDTTINGFNYAGLHSTNMNNVKLITFAGCETANTDVSQYPLAYNAYNQGATTSVGFTGTIYSRSAAGHNWCHEYNNYLKAGYNVYSAALYASQAYGEASNMWTRKIYGATATTITSGTSKSAINTNSIDNNKASVLQSNSNFYEIAINIDMDTEKMEDVYSIPISSYDIDLTKVINEIKNIDTNFDINNYKLSVNIDAPQDNTGTITLTYCIGDDIHTNKNYIVLIENNLATKIIVNKAFVSTELGSVEGSIDIDLIKNLDNANNEESLLKLVKNFKNKGDIKTVNENIANGEIKSHKQMYFYDYYNDVLYYQDSLFYEDPSMNNVIVDESITEYLRGNEKDFLIYD